MFGGHSAGAGLVIGLTAAGVALVVAGARRYRRKQVGGAGARLQADGGAAHAPGAEPPQAQEGDEKMQDQPAPERPLLPYFLLVLALSVPIWLVGGGNLPLPVNLPVSAFMSFAPVTAAAILSYRRRGSDGVRALLRKALDFGKIQHGIWYAPILLLAPLIYVASYAVMRLLGMPLPDPVNVPLLTAPVFFLLYFVGGAGEELGWMGYAIDPMQDRWGALRASIILGLFWGLWHSIPYVQTGNSLDWIFWQTLGAVPRRILIVWVYNNTGRSVFAAILLHAMDNLSWSLFPNYGSHFDPFITTTITALVAAAVVFAWGPATLARYRRARAPRAA